MTPGMIVLFLFIGWVAIAIAAGKFSYRGTKKRWAQVLTVLVVLWLPFWDVLPGWIMYQKAVREIGGVRIKAVVDVDGYLDATTSSCHACWTALNRSDGYRYVEFHVINPDPIAGSLTQIPGYYEFRYEPEGSNQCLLLNGIPGADWMRKNIPKGKCLVAHRRNEPISRYVYEKSNQGWVKLENAGWVLPVEVGWSRIRDMKVGTVIAEAYRFRYKSWLGRQIGFPVWESSRSDSVELPYFTLREVLRPIGVVKE